MLGQLGNRVQHALRAFTPRDQKAVKSAATTLRANPKLDVEAAITELEVGEGLISLLDEKGRPSVVQRAYVIPPGCRLGPVSKAERAEVMRNSAVASTYDKTTDRESAYEKLASRAGAATAGKADAPAGTAQPSRGLGHARRNLGRPRRAPARAARRRDRSATKSAARAIGSSIGRELVRAVGSLLGGGRRR